MIDLQAIVVYIRTTNKGCSTVSSMARSALVLSLVGFIPLIQVTLILIFMHNVILCEGIYYIVTFFIL